AWIETRDGQPLLRVNDTGASYPLTVDPFIQTAKLTASDGYDGDRFGYAQRRRAGQRHSHGFRDFPQRRPGHRDGDN
ncbi:MAG: hypothetical protein ACKV2V_01055, partial [Blastocatellia bacterium]